VGSFAAARAWLTSTKLDAALREAVSDGAFLLGICVGHQLLFDSSDEMGVTPGLAFVRGGVRKLEGALPVPQIGWNKLQFGGAAGFSPVTASGGLKPAAPLFEGIPAGTAFYFVNSYAASNAEDEIASADYGGSFTAAVQRDRVFGVQFHPEKSSRAGLQVLRNFLSCR
jgi:glutamine amidotransferase